LISVIYNEGRGGGMETKKQGKKEKKRPMTILSLAKL
jgi:hypothetical protein